MAPASKVTPVPVTSPSLSFTDLAPAPIVIAPPSCCARCNPTAKLEASKLPVELFEASRPSKLPLPWNSPDSDQRVDDLPMRPPNAAHSCMLEFSRPACEIMSDDSFIQPSAAG